MNHLDLFSGIGGFAYAAREVWGEEYENIGFVEIDSFCQNVLHKNFPGCTIYGDIRAVTNTDSTRPQGQNASRTAGHAGDSQYVDLITGGFPCQPFSQAGKRRGTSDDRYLWPEMLRVIQEFQPTWVVAENVGGLVTWNGGLVFETVCSDLEAAGYEVQPFIIPATAVGAPHRRDRIWFIACNAQYDGQHGAKNAKGNFEGEHRNAAWPDEIRQPEGTDSIRDDVADPRRKRRQTGRGWRIQPAKSKTERTHFDVSSWERNWQEVAATTCVRRVDDGVSARLVRLPDGSEISEAKWRKNAIKAYGNAIVPQVAMQIMEAIKAANGKE